MHNCARPTCVHKDITCPSFSSFSQNRFKMEPSWRDPCNMCAIPSLQSTGHLASNASWTLQLFVTHLSFRTCRQLSQKHKGPIPEVSPHYFPHLGVFHESSNGQHVCCHLRGTISSRNARQSVPSKVNLDASSGLILEGVPCCTQRQTNLCPAG